MTDLSKALSLLWAKTRKETGVTHPLLCHMLDVAAVMQGLWEGALCAGMREFLTEQLGLASEAAAKRTITFWAALHDLGKASPAFQRQYSPSVAELSDAGLSFPRVYGHEPCYHGMISAVVLQSLLESASDLPYAVSRSVARAVGGHHGAWPTPLQLENLPSDQLGEEDWQSVRQELLHVLAALLEPSVVERLGASQQKKNALLMLLSGLTSIADWIGSMEEFFPFAGRGVDYQFYAQEVSVKAQRALRDLNWLGWEPPQAATSFAELFTFEPHRMQQAAIDLASAFTQAGLVIIEAPTGSGKTEAALYLADHWMRVCRQRGLYVAMPTMATSNQMHGRVKEMLSRRYPHLAIEPLLVHSQARWMDNDYRAHKMETNGEHADDTVGDITWFLVRKRALLAPLGVGTVDQALLTVLQTRHFFVRLFGLSHKTVIFDEVHAYDTYMTAIFQRLLGWLRAVNASVVLLSATLPANTRRRLLQTYTGVPAQDLPQVTYPAITWAVGDQIGVVPLEAPESRVILIEWVERDPAALAARLRAELGSGGYAAVICNTVRRAQEIYQALKGANVLPAGQVILFHGQFPFAWRKEIEDRVMARFGKDTDENRHLERLRDTAIVVATQVIEQSLDLDFDLMVTDVAPIDLLIQRAGRLHRHKRPVRPESLRVPRLLICRPEESEEGPDLGSDTYIYDEYVLLRSLLALNRRDRLCLPGETQTLIEAVYGDGPEPSGEWPKRVEKAKQKMQQRQQDETFTANTKLVPASSSDKLLNVQNVGLDDDNPEIHEAFQALTRLGPPSLDVVCLHNALAGLCTEPEGRGLIVDLKHRPEAQVVKELALHTVSITHHQARCALLAQEVPSGWRDHPLLRNHRVAIFTNGICALSGTPYTLRLSRELGLEIRKEVQ